MSIRYYYTTFNAGSPGTIRAYRLFVIIEDAWYWAIEFKSAGEDSPTSLTDFNAGFMSAIVKENISILTEIQLADLRRKFGTFADYIECAVSGFRSYIADICPHSEMKSIIWEITES